MSRLPRFLPALLLVFSAQAAIVPGTESAVTRPVIEPPAFSQGQARIATDGNGFLTVWNDGSSLSGSVLGARVRSDGRRIDETPLPIAATPNDEYGPAVAFDGSRYLVVWTEGQRLAGRFVDPDGMMSERFTIIERPSSGEVFTAPRLAFNGRTFLVAWHAYAGPAVFGAALVDRDGRVGTHIDLGIAEQYFAETALAAAGGEFYFATRRYQVGAPPDYTPAIDVGVTVIAEDGSVGPRTVIAAGLEQAYGLLAATRGEEALIAWTVERAIEAGADGLRAVRITESGIGEVQTLPATAPAIAVVADRVGYLVIYGDGTGSRGWRPGSAETFAIDLGGPSALVRDGATGGQGTFLVVDRNDSSTGTTPTDVFVQPLDRAVLEPVALAQRHQSTPDIAASSTQSLAVWCEWMASEYRTVIAGARIAGDGTSIDERAFEIAQPAGYPAAEPRVASDGSQWLVTWLQSGTLLGKRVSKDGEVDATPFAIAEGIYYSTDVEVEWDGLSYVVVYNTGIPSRLGSNFRIMATRVSRDGTVQTPPIDISGTGGHSRPALAASSKGSLIVWIENPAGVVRGALLSHADSVTPIAFSATPGFFDSVAAAWNEETQTFLVAHSFHHQGIRWSRVTATGQVLPGPASAVLPLARPDGGFGIPMEVTPSGEGFLVTFLQDGNIRAATIRGDAFVGDTALVVSDVPRPERRFGVTGSMLVYARRVDPQRDLLSRVFVRNLQVVANPARRRAVR